MLSHSDAGVAAIKFGVCDSVLKEAWVVDEFRAASLELDAVELLRLQVSLERLEGMPWVHRVTASEEVSCCIPEFRPCVDAQITFLNYHHRRHAMWREEVVM